MSVRALSVLLLSCAVLLPAANTVHAGRASAGSAGSARPAASAQGAGAARAGRPGPAPRSARPQAAGHGQRLHQRIFSRQPAAGTTDKASKPSPLAKRQLVRDRESSARESLMQGKLTAAARTSTASLTRAENGRYLKNQIKNPTIRERFALWRMSRKVAKEARTQLRKRSKAGDVQGARDAMQALAVLEAGGRQGIIARWRNARAANKAFKNSVKNARRAIRKDGDQPSARELQEFAYDIKGDTRSSRSAMRKLMGDSVKLARSYAKQGNPNATWQALQMAEEFATLANRPFNAKNAEKIVNQSFAEAGRILMKEAKADYKAKRFDDAAIKVAELRAIQSQIPEAKMGRSTLSTQRRLTRLLGPRVEDKAGLFNTALSKREIADMASESANERTTKAKDPNIKERIVLSNNAAR